MNFFRHASIQSKLVIVTMTITTVSLLMACAGFTAYEIFSFRAGMIGNLSTLAEIVGNNSAGALDFNDPKAAQETLSALTAESDIAGACIYAANGEIFARYGSHFTPPPKPPPLGHAFRDGNLTLSRSITSKGDVIGTIHIVMDLRALYARLGQYLVIIAVVFILTAIIAFGMSRRLQWVISEPILELARAARAVGDNKEYSMRVQKQNPDEIGALVDGFNDMVAQIHERDANLERRVVERTLELEKLHRQLVDTSRKAGMAEVATSVLHNVGNVLNSVNVSTTLIHDVLAASTGRNVARLAALLTEHQDHLAEFFASDPKAAKVPTYLNFLASELDNERKQLTDEIQLTRRNIDHIKDIVSMQQGYAKFSGVVEQVNPVDLVEDALRLNDAALKRHDVRVVRDFSPQVVNIVAEKHKILQILVNLIRNAKYACDESNRTEKLITLALHGDGKQVQFQVLENGVGIPAENMTRIFNHGFTTRPTGHGFGLHSGALAAREMGGTLTAFSEGPGTGARFTLELPAEPPRIHEQN